MRKLPALSKTKSWLLLSKKKDSKQVYTAILPSNFNELSPNYFVLWSNIYQFCKPFNPVFTGEPGKQTFDGPDYIKKWRGFFDELYGNQRILKTELALP